MPPVYVKGGTWSSTEDEILKAAVQKYGLHEWSRVSSLLPKKSAKQAKARWQEWLNPQIIKSEWVREEDAKLLSLVKVLPNQWRTISSLMGRTSTQCAQRYQQLLDEVADGAEYADLGLSGPGIESIPGTDLGINTASMDAVDLEDSGDEQEQEMLVEAKARLASNQGKKAKRKARERLLKESRRLALIQKKRDLQEMGLRVSLSRKKKSKEFDYNANIPHERVPLSGLYQVDDENEAAAADLQDFEMKVKREGQVLHRESKKKEKTTESKRTIQGAAELINDLSKRPKLDLPSVSSKYDTTLDTQIAINKQQILEESTESSTIDSKFLKALFKKLPEAKFEFSAVIPPFGFGETIDLMPIPEPSVAQRLASQIDDEQAKTRRSQAVQMRLPIPIDRIRVPDDNDDSLTQKAQEMFNQLVRSDYRRYVDNSYRAPLVDDLEQADLDRIEELVQQQSHTPTHEMGDVPAYKLPQLTEETKEAIGRKIKELQDKHTNKRQDLDSITDMFAQREKTLLKRIHEKYAQLQNLDTALELSSKFSEDEQRWGEADKVRLERLVAEIGQQEQLQQMNLRQSA
ncbi:hypothetical protein DIURU_005701 [Diutina rugosa]|uniref:Pre-mRNA-splicing factor CEF1 n=1 Tax=Diutina rugosa TaxID=5481 RepID=A0A642UGM4_DIURU|nr:uncharacterized protein DIURU_005701 [Diutina rugosa]KAA8896689.1 hypothetical protein DIURU_005701 [Diutina rugosa]